MADVTDVASLPFPELTDQPDGPGGINDLATALDHIVIPKYANATARDNANTAPVAGDMCYLTDQAGYYSYTGSVWIRVRFAEQFRRKQTKKDQISTTTYFADPDLTGWVIEPTHRYLMRGQLYVSSADTADYKMKFTGTGLNTTNFPVTGQDHGFWNTHTTLGDSGGNHRSRRWSQEIVTVTDRTGNGGFGGGDYVDVIDLFGLIYNATGSPITLTFEYAPLANVAVTTSTLANSWIQFERI